MFRFRNIFIGIILFISTVCSSGCGEQDPLVIGCIGAFSGANAETGLAVRNGVVLRIEELNAQGGLNGRPVQLLIKDNKGDPALCRQELETFIAQGVQFVLGPVYSKMADATRVAIQGKDVLVMSPTMSTDSLSNLDDNILRVSWLASEQSRSLAGRLIASGAKKAGIVYDLRNKKYSEPLAEKFTEIVKSYGVAISMNNPVGKNGTPDMHKLARQISIKAPENLLLIVSPTDAADLAQHLRKQGDKTNLFGVSWTHSPELLFRGGRAVEGMIVPTILKNQADNPRYQKFVKTFTERFALTPSVISIRGYDAAGLLLEGMLKSTALTPGAVKQTIISMPPYPGVSSMIDLNEFGDSLGAYTLVRVENNAFKALK